MSNINNVKTNTLSSDRRQKIYELYIRGRTNAGLGVAFNSVNKLLSYYPYALIYKNNGVDKGAILYWPNPLGKKIGLSFGNNKNFQKRVVIPNYARRLKSNTNHWYAETSGALEHILTKYHGLVPITNKMLIRKILSLKNNTAINNNGAYVRNIPGVGKHKKRLYGKPIVNSKN